MTWLRIFTYVKQSSLFYQNVSDNEKGPKTLRLGVNVLKTFFLRQRCSEQTS